MKTILFFLLFCLIGCSSEEKPEQPKNLIEKEKMTKQLNAMGIQTILTKPAELSTAVINKYLTLKAKGLL